MGSRPMREPVSMKVGRPVREPVSKKAVGAVREPISKNVRTTPKVVL